MFGWKLVLYTHWRPLFLLAMITVMSAFRNYWRVEPKVTKALGNDPWCGVFRFDISRCQRPRRIGEPERTLVGPRINSYIDGTSLLAALGAALGMWLNAPASVRSHFLCCGHSELDTRCQRARGILALGGMLAGLGLEQLDIGGSMRANRMQARFRARFPSAGFVTAAPHPRGVSVVPGALQEFQAFVTGGSGSVAVL